MRQCPWIFQAPTMSAAIGTKNKMRTRVERREKGSDRLPPYNSFKASVTASRAAEAAVAWGTLDDCFAACELPQQHQLGTLCEPILRKTVIQGPSQTRKDLAHFPTFT